MATIGTGRSPCDEGVARGGKDASPCAEDAKPWVLAATILGSSLAFILSSVINVALPAMQRSLDASVVEMQRIVNAYMLMLGALILVGGSAGDRFGRRRVFALGIVIFTLASVGCALAPDVLTLILARGVHVPSVGRCSSRPRWRSSRPSLARKSGARRSGRGGILGADDSGRAAPGRLARRRVLVAGRLLVDHPAGGRALAVTLWRVQESRDDEGEARLDAWGVLLATAGLGAMKYGLVALSDLGWGHVAVLASASAAHSS